MTRLLSHGITLSILVGFGCLSDETSYSPEQDDAAILELESTWSGGDLTLSLCEDTTAMEEEASPCQIGHLIRGDGRGRRHEVSGGGCGGCPFSNIAYVTATVSGGGMPPNTIMRGEVTLGGDGTDPYSFPYGISLQCVAPMSCHVYGMLQSDGSIVLDVGAPGAAAQVDIAVTRTGVAACP